MSTTKARIKTVIKRVLNGSLRPLDLEIRKVGRMPGTIVKTVHQYNDVPTSFQRLAHMKAIGFNPKVIYDCGAFVGNWARTAASIFSDAHILLVEPNAELMPQIRQATSKRKSRFTIVNVAVSDEDGEGRLNVWDNPRHDNPVTAQAASSLLDHVQGAPTTSMEIVTRKIDTLQSETGLTPDLLKLDLQGGEKKALEGAAKALTRTELVVVEFGCLDAYVDRTTPRDLVELLYDSGFCLYDIVDLRYRPYDGALAGGDFFFVSNSSPLRSHKDYF